MSFLSGILASRAREHTMKSAIHPQWKQITVTCACGNTFTTGSTLDEIRVDICSACHPFYTGSMKFVDTQGRVERFMKARQAAEGKAAKKQRKKKETVEPKSLKDMLMDEKAKLIQAQKTA